MSNNGVYEEAVYLGPKKRLKSMGAIAQFITEKRSDIAERCECGFIEAEYRPEANDVVVRFYKHNGAFDFEETIGYIAEAVDWLRQYTGNRAIKLV